MNKKDFTIIRLAALFEGSSLVLLLFIAVPLKYWLDTPLGVKIIGPAHGILFLTFLSFLLMHYLKRDISLKNTIVGIAASFTPFGTFIYKAKILRDQI